MNAVEFIKQYGWERAKREVALIGTMAVMCCDDDFNKKLKQLVDAWELVDSRGGVEKAKVIVRDSFTWCSGGRVFSNPLEKAIELVESVNE